MEEFGCKVSHLTQSSKFFSESYQSGYDLAIILNDLNALELYSLNGVHAAASAV
jgi:hypothetical protein